MSSTLGDLTFLAKNIQEYRVYLNQIQILRDNINQKLMKSMLNIGQNYRDSFVNAEKCRIISTYNSTLCVPVQTNQTRSLNKVENCLQTSFQRDSNIEYPQMIWDASLNFLNRCYKGEFDEELGLNDESIYLQSFEPDSEHKDLQEIISRNKLLTVKQREQIYLDIKFETGIKTLLEKLSQRFNEEIFHQIVFVCNWSWEKYLNYKKTRKVAPNIQCMNYKKVLNFDQDHDQTIQDSYIPLNDEQVTNQAMKTAEEISGLIYLQSDIKFINLMETQGQKKGKDIRQQFSIFIRSITKSVFLCLQGYFSAPEESQQEFQWSFNDDMNSFEENFSSNQSFNCRKQRKYS